MAMNALDGRFLRVNRALCEITGYSREQLEATTYRSITHPDDLTRNETGIADVLAGRTVPLPHREALHPLGRPRRCRWT